MCQRTVQRGCDPAGRTVGSGSVDVEDWQPGSQEQWRCPRSHGPSHRLACWKQEPFPWPSGSVHPDTIDLPQKTKQTTTTAHGSGRLEGGSRPGLSFLSPQDSGLWETHAEAARLQLQQQGPGAGLPSRLLAAAGGQRPRPAFSGLAQPF